ncbi:GatB/YqeY domain-containing protein [Candidatus Kuenenbacteria bacterium]|nr:GatB/YqeY domain-containing protein [Candidatus Kuenenbacteria bacterium]
MSLLSQLDNDLKSAMIARNSELTDLLRLLKAALKNEMIGLKKQDLTDEEVFKVLKREAKKREDSIPLFTSGNRPELAAKEQAELALIKKYLPAELSEDKIREIVESVIAELGASSPSQFGLVMKAAMAKAGGQADGGVVSRVVKEILK